MTLEPLRKAETERPSPAAASAADSTVGARFPEIPPPASVTRLLLWAAKPVSAASPCSVSASETSSRVICVDEDDDGT